MLVFTRMLVLSGAAARYNNPENETLTDRYMDTAQVRFLDVKIRRCFLEGAKYYDADGVLQREVPDTEIPAEDYEKTFRLFADGVMFWVKERRRLLEAHIAVRRRWM